MDKIATTIYLVSFMVLFAFQYKIVGLINDAFLHFTGVFLFILMFCVVPGIGLVSLTLARKLTDLYINRKN
ncbi:high-affinity Fe2+/Pb2+ permease [Cerasibacillus quisquiliarum]|uniref:Uncharacterized protein n=1 Tax=Cerasibacillus quisquiliarum TaxID=227865 RepID=A0A511UZU6_9BACI|nr:hypothetical protein [Cerasibacillus quisquiliarum]MBB5146549.1 high-affinity Fe2+/Pb2+ permease [Cerasibacillus quisquiliarum]GEN31248.1 hypothetical protein CQU01_14860 [Cerasibacillus quisquiliarum]